jgi:hypothetical protein
MSACICGTEDCTATPELILAHRVYVDTNWSHGMDESGAWYASMARAARMRDDLTKAGYLP